jgi:hypothetical protein
MSKVGEVVRFGDKGISVEQARRNMLEAGQAPKGLQREVRKNEAVGVTAPVVQPASVIAEPVATVEPVIEVPAPTPEPVVEKIENKKFIASIFQEGGQWVAELVYKNGAGTERFEAPSKQTLTLKLLEGKGNATLRVRESIRREKYGVELDKMYTLPDGVTQETYDAMPEAAQRLLLDTVATQNGVTFKDLHPEYYPTENNSDKLQKFLNKRDLPYTLRNIEFAFEELMDSDELDVRPQDVAPTVPAPAPLAVDSASATALITIPAPAAVVPAAPAVAVRKRGTTGLRPGDASAVSTELEQTEEGQTPQGPSEAELRKLPLSELQKLARKTYKPRNF